MTKFQIVKILSRILFLFVIYSIIGLFTSSLIKSGKAGEFDSVNATMGSLCGKLVFLTEKKTEALRLGLKPCGGNEKPYVFDQNPADLFNVYQFKDVEIESGAVFESTEYGKLTKYITGWKDYYQIASCADCNTGKMVIPTATITLTPEIIPTETKEPVIEDTITPTLTPLNVAFVITNFEAEPGNPVLNQRLVLRLTIENQGNPLEEPGWGYTGQVLLKDANGSEVESYSFSRGKASYIKQVEENGQAVTNKWIISIPVYFSHEVENGRLSVALQPDLYPISPNMVEALVTLKPANIDNKSYVLSVADKVGSMFSDDPALKTAWDGEKASIIAASCPADDVGCYASPLVQGLIKTLLISYPDIQQNAWTAHETQMNKLLSGLAGIFEVNTLQVCQQPDQWLWKIVEELNRQGLPVNILNISPSAVMKIGNAAGEISGVLISGEIVNQMPESQVVQWNRQIFIVYSPQEILITAQGVEEGTFTLKGIITKSGERVSIAYENIPITEGAMAVVNSADPSGQMQLDSNNDGQTDSVVQLTKAEVIPVSITPPEAQPTAPAASSSKTPFQLPCMSASLVVLPLAGIFFLRVRKKTG